MSDIRKTIVQTQEDMDRYYAAFGRFIAHFSQVEQRLHSLLWEMSGAPLDLVRVAFADARFAQITNLINRLYSSRGESEHPLYRRAVDQLGKINTTRNEMVHFGAAMAVIEANDELVMFVSNEIKAIPGRGTSYTVTEEMIGLMLYDLNTAMACLTIVLADLHDAPATALQRNWTATAHRAWRYTPPAQSAGRAKPQGRARKQPPQPQSSEE